MLEVGRSGTTGTEQRSHFAKSVMMAAPLIAGKVVRKAPTATLGILKHAGLIAVDHDPPGQQANQVSFDGTRRVLAQGLAIGDFGYTQVHTTFVDWMRWSLYGDTAARDRLPADATSRTTTWGSVLG